MDKSLGYLFNLFKREKLYDRLNIVIVSDHGMTSMMNDSVIQLNDHVNTSLIDFNRTILEESSLIYPISDEAVNY